MISSASVRPWTRSPCCRSPRHRPSKRNCWAPKSTNRCSAPGGISTSPRFRGVSPCLGANLFSSSTKTMTCSTGSSSRSFNRLSRPITFWKTRSCAVVPIRDVDHEDVAVLELLQGISSPWLTRPRVINPGSERNVYQTVSHLAQGCQVVAMVRLTSRSPDPR